MRTVQYIQFKNEEFNSPTGYEPDRYRLYKVEDMNSSVLVEEDEDDSDNNIYHSSIEISYQQPSRVMGNNPHTIVRYVDSESDDLDYTLITIDLEDSSDLFKNRR